MNAAAPFPAASQYLLAQFDCLDCFAGQAVASAETQAEGRALLGSVVAHCFEAQDDDSRVVACAEALWHALEAFARDQTERAVDEADDARARLVGDVLSAHFPDGVVTFPLK
jgi:hypothetical protein